MTDWRFAALALTVLLMHAHAMADAPPGPVEGGLAMPCESYIVIEANTGLVLAEHQADVPRAPASMVKMMVMFLAAEGVEAGKWRLDDEVTISAEAQRMGGSQMFLKEGERFPLGSLLLAAGVASANDASYAVGEFLFGSEADCLEAMNARADELGMVDTTFNSLHGLPPDPGEAADVSTARDMAILAQWCVRQPLLMQWAGQENVALREGDAPKYNTNKLLWRMDGADGLKTGFTRAAGYCLTATAEREGIRLIGVVMGCDRLSARFSGAEAILEYGFANVRKTPMLAEGAAVDAEIRVRNFEGRAVRPRLASDLVSIIHIRDIDRVQLMPSVSEELEAPLAAGTVVGELLALVDGNVRGRAPLIIHEPLQAAGWHWKLREAAQTGVRGDS